MSASKRIPATEETRRELHELKEPGQTYDDLLKQFAQQRRRRDMEQRFQELEADREKSTSLLDGAHAGTSPEYLGPVGSWYYGCAYDT